MLEEVGGMWKRGVTPDTVVCGSSCEEGFIRRTVAETLCVIPIAVSSNVQGKGTIASVEVVENLAVHHIVISLLGEVDFAAADT